MPQEINFPDSLDDDNSLYIVVNNLRTRLTSSITDAVTTIPVISTAGYPNVGFVTILTGGVITNAEAIAYSGTDATNFLNAERGSDGTAALAHSSNDNVDLTIVARHHENVKDAIIEIERFIGVSGSENFVPFVDGNVVLPGTLSVEETITVSGGANFCFVAVTGTLTVSGIPVMINVPDNIVINSIQAESATFTDLTVTGTGSFTNSLTVSGVPVSTGTGAIDDPLNIGTLNASLSLTISGEPVSTGTVSSDLILDSLVVTGGTSLCGDVDIKGDLTVSGTGKFGQADATTSGIPIIFASQETEQNTTSTSFIDANCETAVLSASVDYIVLYTGNIGSNGSSNGRLRVSFDGTAVANVGYSKSLLGTFGDNSHNTGFCHGIYRVTGNGTGTVKFEFRADASATVYAGAMAITCIPLDQFTQDTDYFYAENTNSDAFDVINASATDPPPVTLLNDTFSSMSAGDWIFLWSAEGDADIGAIGSCSLRFQVASGTIGVSRFTFGGNAQGALRISSVAAANIVNVAGGDTIVDILVGGTAVSDYRRGRIFAIKSSLFTQVISTTDTTGFTTSSTGFTDFSGLNTTISPTNTNAPIIVITSAPTYTQDSNSGMVSAIRNETSSTNFRIDSGGRDAFVGGVGSAHVDLFNSFMVHFEERSSSTEYRYQIRSDGGGDVSVGRDEDDAGGELSEMIIWEFDLAGAAFIPITQTCIDDDEIQTGTVVADTINARVSLTVSGVPVGGLPDPLVVASGIFSQVLTISGQPVSTGTVDTDALADLFVNKTGDTMTGNLDMLGNNVLNAGVAAVQDAAPILVTSGLLWFDSDAVGSFPSDPNIPKGGIFAATVSTSSGITLPDDSSIFLPWDTEDLDEGGWFESEFPTRLTVPSGVTHLQAQAGVGINVNDFGDRNVQISLTTITGTEVVATQQWSTASGTRTVAQVTSKIVTVSGGDYLQVSAFQDSGGTLDTFVAGDYYFSALAVNTRGVPGVNSVNLLKGDISILPGSGVEVTSNSGDNTILISTVSGLSDTRTFFTAPTSGASATVLNTVVLENGLVKSWTQV